MRKVIAAIGVVLASSTALLMSPVPAQAGTAAIDRTTPSTSSSRAAEQTLLVVKNGDTSATINCDAIAASTHPYAAEACAEIDAVKGEIAAIPPLPKHGCLGVWLPVTISVSGIWQGGRLSYSEVASNSGCGRISHLHVFYF